jgi:hypothetical protein
MTVTIINKTNRMKVIPLPHKTYCEALGRCACVALPGMKRKVASSIVIPAGGELEVEEAVMGVAQVVRLVKRGEVSASAKATTDKRKKTRARKTRDSSRSEQRQASDKQNQTNESEAP